MRARLDFPDDLELFAEGILIDGSQRDGMLLHTAQLGRIHFSHHPLSTPHFDELAWFWDIAVAAVFRRCSHC
ncbi:hypothetical protein D3C76_721180 [compost metagenome]